MKCGDLVKAIFALVSALFIGALVGAIPAMGQTQTTATVYLGGRNATDWGQHPLVAPTYHLGARFRFTGDTQWQVAGDAVDFKQAGANPSTVKTGNVNLIRVPTQMQAYAQSTRTFSQIALPPQYRADWVGNLVFKTNVPPTLPAEGQLWIADPFGFVIGDVGTSLTITQSLGAGTSFLRTNIEPGQPNLNLYSRLGLGSSFSPDDPTALWGDSGPIPTSPPANAFDLFSISIVENAAGTGVRAIVGPDPSANIAGFDIISNRSADEIKTFIESANWSRSGDFWTLGSNLDLYQIQLVNQSVTNQGLPLVIGHFASNGAIVPEPGTSVLMLIGAAAVAVLGWRRRRTAVDIAVRSPTTGGESCIS